jgi:hypothetical protein
LAHPISNEGVLDPGFSSESPVTILTLSSSVLSPKANQYDQKCSEELHSDGSPNAQLEQLKRGGQSTVNSDRIALVSTVPHFRHLPPNGFLYRAAGIDERPRKIRG